jgi:hypothetical protein
MNQDYFAEILELTDRLNQNYKKENSNERYIVEGRAANQPLVLYTWSVSHKTLKVSRKGNLNILNFLKRTADKITDLGTTEQETFRGSEEYESWLTSAFEEEIIEEEERMAGNKRKASLV